MKRDPETYELFPAGSESRVLLAGLCGALIGATIFGFLAGMASGLLNSFFFSRPWIVLLLNPVFCAVSAFVLYCVFSPIFFLIGFLFSHLTGHAMDLRTLAVVKASATVYLPLSYFTIVSIDWPSTSNLHILSGDILTVFTFLVPAMTFVSTGAWIWADGQLDKSLTAHVPLTRRFGLRKLFVATFLLALLLFFNQLFNISILLWVGYVVLLVPVSLLTAFLVRVRNSWPKRLRRKTVGDSPEGRSKTQGEAIESFKKPDNEDA